MSRTEQIRDFIETYRQERGALPSAREVQKSVGGDTHAILDALQEARRKDGEMNWKERIAFVVKKRDDAAAHVAELTREMELLDKSERTGRASALIAEATRLLDDERTEQLRAHRAALESGIRDLESELATARKTLAESEAGLKAAHAESETFVSRYGADAEEPPKLRRERLSYRMRFRSAQERIAATESRLEAARTELASLGTEKA